MRLAVIQATPGAGQHQTIAQLDGTTGWMILARSDGPGTILSAADICPDDVSDMLPQARGRSSNHTPPPRFHDTPLRESAKNCSNVII